MFDFESPLHLWGTPAYGPLLLVAPNALAAFLVRCAFVVATAPFLARHGVFCPRWVNEHFGCGAGTVLPCTTSVPQLVCHRDSSVTLPGWSRVPGARRPTARLATGA